MVVFLRSNSDSLSIVEHGLPHALSGSAAQGYVLDVSRLRNGL